MYKSSKHAISRDHSELEETGQDVIFWVNGCYDDYYRGLENDQHSDRAVKTHCDINTKVTPF